MTQAGHAPDPAATAESSRARWAALRTQWLVLAFYAIDAALMAGFAARGAVPAVLPWAFGLGGAALTLLFASAVWLGLHRRLGGARFTSAQLLSACALMLATAAAVPQMGLLLLMTMLVAMATAAVQMPQRHVLAVTLIVGLCALLLVLVQGPALGLPLADRWERLFSGLWFGIVLAKIALINLIGSALRRALVDSNRRLAVALEQVRELSERDELTGLANRRSVMVQLEQAVARCAGGGAPLAVALLDIDHFKHVNDTHGHAAGDEVLRAFAGAVSARLRSSDRVARYGGEEFLLLLPGCGENAAAAQAADRARLAVEQHAWHEVVAGLRVTVSVGVAVCQPGEAAAALLQRADAALYRAKAEGRNTVRVG
jgi:diguanylate cyclase (GGDEF)-like protein